MDKIVKNKIFLDRGVWRLEDKEEIDYSDGIEHEKFIKKILLQTNNLSSDSDELTEKVKDWTSEYHLSKKRSQLLKGFLFDPSKRVLEVGCGCGAITRFLGENFNEVVSVEGTFARAELARLRTQGMESVNIINGPFQSIDFQKKFDLIICIGVFEYSSSFIDAKDPHDEVLRYFSEILSPDGIVLIAIENQFGLKYFSSSKEDHTSVMFDGIEGYPRFTDKAKTYGIEEIKKRLAIYFEEIKFFFPYPDYKIPSCILSENALNIEGISELISGHSKSRDNEYFAEQLFDEQLVLAQIEKNKKLDFFSNSFLIIAGKKNIEAIKFPQEGLFFNSNRKTGFQTVSKIEVGLDEEIYVNKFIENKKHQDISINAEIRECRDRWIKGYSLQAQLFKGARIKDNSLEKLFKPCKLWTEKIDELCEVVNGVRVIDGSYIDFIWRNTFFSDGEAVFIDREWVWKSKIEINVLVIRAIFYFLLSIKDIKDKSLVLSTNSYKSLIKKIANTQDIKLTNQDFHKFYELETSFSRATSSVSKRISYSKLFLNFYTTYTSLFLTVKYVKNWSRAIVLFPKKAISSLVSLLYKIFKAVRG